MICMCVSSIFYHLSHCHRWRIEVPYGIIPCVTHDVVLQETVAANWEPRDPYLQKIQSLPAHFVRENSDRAIRISPTTNYFLIILNDSNDVADLGAFSIKSSRFGKIAIILEMISEFSNQQCPQKRSGNIWSDKSYCVISTSYSNFLPSELCRMLREVSANHRNPIPKFEDCLDRNEWIISRFKISRSAQFTFGPSMLTLFRLLSQFSFSSISFIALEKSTAEVCPRKTEL